MLFDSLDVLRDQETDDDKEIGIRCYRKTLELSIFEFEFTEDWIFPCELGCFTIASSNPALPEILY